MISRASRVVQGLCAGLVLFLAACGGGGGSGGPDLSTAPGLSVSPTSVAFTAVHNGAVPPAQSIQITLSGSGIAFIVVSYLATPTLPTWLTQSPSLTGSGSNYTFTGGPITTSLAPGTYTATIRIAIEDAGHNTLAFRDASVSYTIQPLTGLAANPLSLDFIQLQGAPAPVAQNLGISELGGASYAWNASVVYQSGSGWLNINGAASASGATLPTSLSISVNPSGALGTLSAIVRVTGNGNTLDVPVRYALLEPQVSPPAVSLSFDAVRGGALPPTQGVPFSTQGNVPVNYTSTVAYNGGSGWLSTPASGTFPGTVSVSMNTSNLASGIYTAEIRLATATRTIIVYVGYTVSEPRIGRPSPDFLIFNAASSGALPPAQSVALSTDQNLTVPYTVLVSYDEGSGWLSTPAGGTAPGSLSLGVSTTDLPPGTYFAHVLLASADRVGREFIVEYSVSPSSLTLSPAAASFTIDSNSLPSALSKTVTVGATGSALSWTALSSQPWISVSPTSGLSGTPITVSLDAAQIGTFDPGTRSAPITFSYTSQSGIPTRATLPVTLNLLLPKVNYVSPYVELPNTSTEVILRGSGFSNATGLNVMFGGTPVSISNANVISDTEIRVSHPSLAAGKYLVAIPNQLGLTRSRASLVVAAPPTFTAVAVPSSLQRDRIIYDAERVAAYTNNNFSAGAGGTPRIERNRLVAGNWVTDSLVLNGSPLDIAMSPDGLELIAITPSTLYHIDLGNWTISLQFDISTVVSVPQNVATFVHLAMGNDGNALVFAHGAPQRVFVYNVLTTHTFAPLVTFNDFFDTVIAPVSSIDGRRILVGTGSPSNLYYFDTSLARMIPAVPGFGTNRLAYDRTGTNSLIDGTAYNRQFQVLGTGGINLSHAAISPDGTRGYGVVPGENPSILRTYDLTNPIGGVFSEIGTGITLPDLPGEFLAIGITPDGRTVFVSGEKNFIVQPLP